MNLKALDADSVIRYLKSGGDGTEVDPLVVEHSDSTAHLLLTSIQQKLAEIASYTDILEALFATLNNYSSAIETLLTATNSTQSTISGFVDQLEGYTDGIEGNQATEIARLEAIRDRFPSALVDGKFSVQAALSGTARTTSFLNTTTDGTIAAGASSVSIANVGSVAGTIKGVVLPSGASISWSGNGNDTLDAIAYSATNTNFLITTVV